MNKRRLSPAGLVLSMGVFLLFGHLSQYPPCGGYPDWRSSPYVLPYSTVRPTRVSVPSLRLPASLYPAVASAHCYSLRRAARYEFGKLAAQLYCFEGVSGL